MPVYRFSARQEGELVTGTRTAASSGALAQDLMNAGLLPVDIEVQTEEQTATAARWLNRQGVSLAEIIVFSYQMASLSQAGISVIRAIKTLG